MASWIDDAVFYHVYPLGYCGAPTRNDLSSPPVARLDKLAARLDGIAALGANALYLGPLFESVAHGYDTVDYRLVDRRLGTNADLARFSREAKAKGFRIVLDGVFNHVGREHPWFRRLREEGQLSPSTSKFRGIDFSARSPAGDPFSYEGWNGCHDLVRLDLGNPEVRRELISAVLSWIDDYDIDGLRLDAADCVDLGFQAELAAACRARKADFWLMGEIIHGDYRRWAGGGPLDSVTNYECWKGLWSSLKDANYHEIAYALRRQSGEGGLYRDLLLYNFADNHDVDRAASLLPDSRLLYPLYCLLFTMPGIPSIYYGSELGARGARSRDSDLVLRPGIEELEASPPPEPDLSRAIGRLARLRRGLPALRRGAYRELSVSARQLAFARESPEGWVLVALNASDKAVDFDLPLPGAAFRLRDALEATGGDGRTFEPRGGRVRFTVHPHWAGVLAPA
jgi:glycosidase